MWELPAEGLPQVTELLPDFFAARRSVRAVPRIDHVFHLGGISPESQVYVFRPGRLSGTLAWLCLPITRGDPTQMGHVIDARHGAN